MFICDFFVKLNVVLHWKGCFFIIHNILLLFSYNLCFYNFVFNNSWVRIKGLKTLGELG